VRAALAVSEHKRQGLPLKAVKTLQAQQEEGGGAYKESNQ